MNGTDVYSKMQCEFQDKRENCLLRYKTHSHSSFLKSIVVTLVCVLSFRGFATAAPSAAPTMIPSYYVTPLLQITTVAGIGSSGSTGYGGYATAATFSEPIAVYADNNNNLYISDANVDNNIICRVDGMTNIIRVIAGVPNTAESFSDVGQATSVMLNNPAQMLTNTDLGLVFADQGSFRIRAVSLISGIISTIAGPGAEGFSGDGGPPTSAQLGLVVGVCIDTVGTMYVSAGSNHIRKITPDLLTITTIAGTGEASSTGDGGAATSATVNIPYQLFVSSSNILYIADNLNNKVRRIELSANIIDTFAGTGISGTTNTIRVRTSTDLKSPRGVWGDSLGYIFISEFYGHKIKKTSGSNNLMTIAGTNTGSPSATAANGDGGRATSATFFNPVMVCVDSFGFVIVADSGNKKIRKVYDYAPTLTPSSQPLIPPTGQPSRQPSGQPSTLPSRQPSGQPSCQPSQQPKMLPTCQPSCQPSAMPTSQPSSTPTAQPSMLPTCQPSYAPSYQPSAMPTCQPGSTPTVQPSMLPTCQPSFAPSCRPSALPSCRPSALPTCQPSVVPSCRPSALPTCQPSVVPSCRPSAMPTCQPSVVPSCQPSAMPTRQPSSSPTCQPSEQPNTQPSSQPSCYPSICPSMTPSCQPSKQPSVRPSTQPMALPSCQPSRQPTVQPSIQPMPRPSSQPSRQPSEQPSGQPSRQPSARPLVFPPATVPLFTGETSKPSPRPTSGPTPESTMMSPTHSLPLNTDVSVRYTGNFTVEFKIMLPFLFTNPVMGELVDIVVGAADDVKGYLYQGNAVLSVTQVSVQEMLYFLPSLSSDYSGRSVSNAGDVNGDGFPDLIIGMPYLSRCYVLFGTHQGFVNMTTGFTILGADPSDLTGWSVSSAGDVNNDTYADILIGAPNGGSDQSGMVYVIYGKGSTFVLIDLGNLHAEDGYAIVGVAERDSLGVSVSNAGDINGDGFDDIVLGALRMSINFAGAVYIVYGRASKRTSNLRLSYSANTLEFVSIGSSSYSWFGYSVASAGDVNGDGLGDIIIGSVPRRMTVGTPVGYLLYGATSIAVKSINTMTTTQGLMIVGAGEIVSGVGDLNGDGFDDVMLSAGVNFNSGNGYVVTFPRDLNNSLSSAPVPVPSIPPSRLPSFAPSIKPSVKPSATPSRQPTQPTVEPTLAPSGPTKLPTMIPTQPTSVPSAKPTAPSLTPSVRPTETPTEIPSKEPSESPTVLPSDLPTAAPTLTFSPSELPGGGVARLTRRPSSSKPTVTPTNFEYVHVKDQYATVHVRIGNETKRHDVISTNYYIATPEVVYMMGKGSLYGDVFTPITFENGTLIISRFSRHNDKINLTMYDYYSVNDLTMISGSVIIKLPLNQQIVIQNLHPSDMSERNFLFRAKPIGTQYWKHIAHVSEAVGGCIFIGILYMLYQRYIENIKYTLKYNASLCPVDKNPTRIEVEGSFSKYEWDDDKTLDNEEKTHSTSCESECDRDSMTSRSSDDMNKRKNDSQRRVMFALHPHQDINDDIYQRDQDRSEESSISYCEETVQDDQVGYDATYSDEWHEFYSRKSQANYSPELLNSYSNYIQPPVATEQHNAYNDESYKYSRHLQQQQELQQEQQQQQQQSTEEQWYSHEDEWTYSHNGTTPQYFLSEEDQQWYEYDQFECDCENERLNEQWNEHNEQLNGQHCEDSAHYTTVMENNEGNIGHVEYSYEHDLEANI